MVGIRNALGKLSDSDVYRKQAKVAIKSANYSTTIDLFNTVDFKLCANLPADEWKNIAFQIGQMLGLIEGKEYYTKGEVANIQSKVILLDSQRLSRTTAISI